MIVSWLPLKEPNPKYSFKGPVKSNACLLAGDFLVFVPVDVEDDLEEAMKEKTET
jgi:hypothetical protein